MRLTFETDGTSKNNVIRNAATGEMLEGVKSVKYICEVGECSHDEIAVFLLPPEKGKE
jgi:hypothetical protein